MGRSQSPDPIPYQAGMMLKVYRHEPPPHPPQWSEQVHHRMLRERLDDRALLVRENPPRAGPKGTLGYGRSAVLEIVQALRMYKYKALTAVCVLREQGQTPRRVFAKIFDPIFYHKWDPSTSLLWDYAYAADEEYIRTANAHKRLDGHKEIAGLVPRFFGSWTTRMPLPLDNAKHTEHQEHSVRIVLEEYIGATLLRTLDPEKYSSAARENVVARALEAGTLLNKYGVDHMDISPRNIFVSSEKLDDPELKVVLVDFGIAECDDPVRDGPLPDGPLQRRSPMNPATYDFRAGADLDAWLPEKYQEKETAVLWAYLRWRSDPRFPPVSEKVINFLKDEKLLV